MHLRDISAREHPAPPRLCKCKKPLGPSWLVSLQLVQSITQDKRLMLSQEMAKVPVALSRVHGKSLIGCQSSCRQRHETFDGVAGIAAAEKMGDYGRLRRRDRVSRRL